MADELNGRPVSAANFSPRASTAAERVDQIAGEDDASCLLLRKSALDELLGPAVHGVAYLGAEASLAEGHRLPCDGLPVEPGCAAGRHLGFNGKIGARSSTMEPGVLSPAASRSGSLM